MSTYINALQTQLQTNIDGRADIMVQRRMFEYILIGLSIANAQSTQNDNAMQGEFVITDSKSLKTIELRNTSNTTSTIPAGPTVVQQGNNVFIKPKFIYGSPFTSYKNSYSNSENNSAISKETEESTEFFQPPRLPILVDKPVRLETIPPPPQLPPLILPKLPIQVVIKRPILPNGPVFIPVPEMPVVFQPLCTPTQRCISQDRTVPGLFTGIFEKIKNLLSVSNKIDLLRIFVPNETTFQLNLPPVFPTLCAQNIIAERVVPNIVNNENVKVYLSPMFPSQIDDFDVSGK